MSFTWSFCSTVHHIHYIHLSNLFWRRTLVIFFLTCIVVTAVVAKIIDQVNGNTCCPNYMSIYNEGFKVGPSAQSSLTMQHLQKYVCACIYMCVCVWVCFFYYMYICMYKIYMSFAYSLNYSTIHNNFWLSALSSRSVVFKFFLMYTPSVNF